MKTLILFLLFPILISAQEQETEVFQVNEAGLQELVPKQIIIETEYTTESYKTNELGIRNLLPEVVIEKKNEQDIEPINYIEDDNKGRSVENPR